MIVINQTEIFERSNMDVTTIAASVVTLLIPYIKKASEEFAGEAGKAVFLKTGELLTRLKQYFTGDEAAGDTISRFEQNPERYQPFFEDVLKEKLEKDSVFQNEIVHRLMDIEKSGPEIEIVQKMKKVKDIVGLEAGQISKGKVKIVQKIEEGEKIVGTKIDHLG